MMEMEFKKETTSNNTPLPEKGPVAERTDAEVKNGSIPPVPEKEPGSQRGVTMNMSDLESKTKEQLVEMAKEIGLASPNNLKKHDIIMRLLESHTEQQGNIFCSGIVNPSIFLKCKREFGPCKRIILIKLNSNCF